LAEVSAHDRLAIEELRNRFGDTVRCDDFIRFALYDPEFGYYSKHVRGIGRSGDFSTSATLSPVLGTAIGGWLKGRRPRRSGRWHAIEVGAGSGELAAAVLKGVGPLGRLGLRYHIVEASSVLQTEQARRLRSSRVQWHPDVATALRSCGGEALIISNELVDVFPCRVFRRRNEEWFEQYVTLKSAEPETDWRPAEALPDSSIFGEDLPERQVVETHESYRDWMAGWISSWKTGALLTIDYGAPAHTLYYRKPHGSLRGYFFHQMTEGHELFTRIGRQDLTADVNFSDLQRWGAALGCSQGRLRTQAEFIHTFHPGAVRKSREDPAVAFLTDPHGAGGAFKVLEQTRLSRRRVE